MGTGSKTKIYDISSNSIDYRLQQALPSLHALSGCDSTSCFSGIGKAKCLKVLQTDQRFLDAACLLGEEENPSETVTEVLEEYVCHLYGNKKETSINTTRYKFFSTKKKLPDPQKLPPTKDALYLHFARANYQVREWKSALNIDYEQLDPDGKGWTTENNILNIKWMNQKPAPESILEFVSCQCRKNACKTGLCRCRNVNLLCSDICNCTNCENIDNNHDFETSYDSSSGASDQSASDESESENEF